MVLNESPVGIANRVEQLRGDGSFRRRLMELGLLPGTTVTVVGRAPLGGPLELLVRGCSLTLGREEAGGIEVSSARVSEAAPARHARAPAPPAAARPPTAGPRGWIRASLRGPRTST